MALKGNIETFYLSSILQLLAQDKKTGILTIAEEGRIVRVYIKNGNIVYAVGSQKEVRLGYLLRTKGIISAEELQKALASAKKRKERLGKILVEMGFISVETLKKFIHQQVREILYDLFLWKNGAFEYVDKEVSLEVELTTELLIRADPAVGSHPHCPCRGDGVLDGPAATHRSLFLALRLKNNGPDQCEPVTCFAIADKLRKSCPSCS